MRAKRLVLASGLIIALTGCATAPPDDRIAHTPSHRPEAIFEGQKVDQVSGRIAAFCMDHGHVVVATSANMVVCRGEMTAGETFAARMRIGSRFAGTPELTYSFNIVQVGSDVRVQAIVMVNSSSAFGQKLGYEVEDSAAFNDVEQSLLSLGGHAPA